jgi:hypothetical protein
VYAHPTITKLAAALEAAVSSIDGNFEESEEAQVRQVLAAIDFYSTGMASMAQTHAAPIASGAVTFLVTGTTGSLGSRLLYELLADPRVNRVYAFNRPSRESSSQQRQSAAFLKRGLPCHLFAEGKVIFIDADASKPRLGLDERLYTEVSHLTAIRVH